MRVMVRERRREVEEERGEEGEKRRGKGRGGRYLVICRTFPD